MHPSCAMRVVVFVVSRGTCGVVNVAGRTFSMDEPSLVAMRLQVPLCVRDDLLQ